MLISDHVSSVYVHIVHQLLLIPFRSVPFRSIPECFGFSSILQNKVAPHCCCYSNRSCVHQQYRKSMFLLLLTTSDHEWCWHMGSLNLLFIVLFAGVHSVRNVTAPVSLVQGDHTGVIVTQANCIMCMYFAF